MLVVHLPLIMEYCIPTDFVIYHKSVLSMVKHREAVSTRICSRKADSTSLYLHNAQHASESIAEILLFTVTISKTLIL